MNVLAVLLGGGLAAGLALPAAPAEAGPRRGTAKVNIIGNSPQALRECAIAYSASGGDKRVVNNDGRCMAFPKNWGKITIVQHDGLIAQVVLIASGRSAHGYMLITQAQ